MSIQPQLLEPPPTRRIIVPRGHFAHWGIDPSTRGVSVSGVEDARTVPEGTGDLWVQSTAFRTHSGPHASLTRLSDVHYESARFARHLVEKYGPPGLVWVERPGGKSRNYALDYALGTIVAGMDEAIEAATGHRVRFEEVEPASWKKTACGRGNLYKPDKKKGRTAEYPVLLWARELGYSGMSYDEADAIGIAEAARRTVALEPR